MVDYPKEVFCEWGNNCQINAEYNLVPAKEESGDAPMKIHGGNLSRYVLTIVDKSGGTTKVVNANIPWNEVSVIHEKTKRAGILMDMKKMLTTAPSSTSELSAAYTTVISLGYFKGKTPADVLLSDPSNKEKLQGTKDFYAKNIDKYPANRKVMDAIDDAISLFDAGKLTKEESVPTPTASGSYVVYERQFKNKKPYVDSKRTIYNVKISCEFANKYPWHIEITNFLAPMKPGAGGQLLPDMSQASDKKVASINLSDDVWIESADILYRRLMQFETSQFEKAEKTMNELSWKPGKTVEETDAGVQITA